MSELVEVIVGTIGRAHGIRGDVSIEVRTDEPERRFAVGQSVRVEGHERTLEVKRTAWHSGRLLVHFKGIDDRTAAEGLRGLVLVVEVPSDELPEAEDEYWDRQLVGLHARTRDGREVGVVTQVVHLPEQDLLAIDVDGTERLIPFVNELVPQVDLRTGTLVVVDRPGLLSDEGAEVVEPQPEGD